jgi:hypothetical protein
MRGALPGMAFKQLRHRVQQEREEQAIRLGEIEPSFEGTSGRLPLTERGPGGRLQQECGDQRTYRRACACWSGGWFVLNPDAGREPPVIVS